MKTREGTKKDIPYLWKIDKENAKKYQKIIPKKYQKLDEVIVKVQKKEDFVKDFTKNMEQDNSFFLVVEEKGIIKGFLSVDVEDFFGGIKETSKIAQIVEFQISGNISNYEEAGKKLITKLEKISKNKGCEFIFWNIPAGDEIELSAAKQNKFDLNEREMVKKIK